MSRFHRRRYVDARHIARRLGVSTEMFLSLYEQPLWRIPRPRVVGPSALGQGGGRVLAGPLAHVQPPSFGDWLAMNGHRVAPYTVGWSLLELLRPASPARG